MEFTLVLFTGFALVAAAVAVFAMWRCLQCERRAEHACNRLVKTQGTVLAHGTAIEALDDRLRRLNGRVNAEVHRRRAGAVADDDDAPGFNFTRGVDPVEPGMDPELAAELRLQSAPNARPNGSA